MTSQSNLRSSPQLPTLVAVAMVAASLVLVAGARIAGFEPQRAAALSDIKDSRLIRFEHDTTGSIKIIDAETGGSIAIADREGFIPGILRGLNRLRRTGDGDISAAYRLDKAHNGQLLLTDTITGVTLDLNAYGQDNAQIFAKFLQTGGDNS